MRRWGLATIVIAMVIGGCSGAEDSVPTTTSPSATTTEASDVVTTTVSPSTSVPPTTTTTSPPSTTTTAVSTEVEAGVERTDWLTFAWGAIPVEFVIEGPGDGLSTGGVMQTIDGNSVPRILVESATADTVVEITIELPAPTVFDRFAIPSVDEVPGASVTFFQTVEVSGAEEQGSDFVRLATATLETHADRDQVTELELETQDLPVRLVRIRLSGGINILEDASFLEFSEIIGNGEQAVVPLVDGFTGVWDVKLPDVDRSVGLIELRQDGVVVTGCFESADLTGTVTGNLVRLSGVNRDDGTPSAYVFVLDRDDRLQGVISSNGGPFGFSPTVVAPADSLTTCSDVEQPEVVLGCGSVVYGISFDFNSADLRSDSERVLQQLFEGLASDSASAIVVVGHTSTEGSDSYNLDLSNRRAQSVVDDLVARGIDASRISAIGRGETEPLLSPDDDEAARSINRRVEIACS